MSPLTRVGLRRADEPRRFASLAVHSGSAAD